MSSGDIAEPAGIVFNARFFDYFDIGTWLLFEVALGVKRSEIATAFGIIGYEVVDAKARFIAPVNFGDRIEIASTVKEFGARASTSTPHYQPRHAGRSKALRRASGPVATATIPRD